MCTLACTLMCTLCMYTTHNRKSPCVPLYVPLCAPYVYILHIIVRASHLSWVDVELPGGSWHAHALGLLHCLSDAHVFKYCVR